jgi:hypothetical protein
MAGMILEAHLLTARTLAADDMLAQAGRRYTFMAARYQMKDKGTA